MSTNIFQRDLDLARNGLGQPLDEDCRARLAAAVQRPGQETWDAAYTILVNPTTTLWQAVRVVDPAFRGVQGPATQHVNAAVDCEHPEDEQDFTRLNGHQWFEVCGWCGARRLVCEPGTCQVCDASEHHVRVPDPERAVAVRGRWSRTPDSWAIRQAIAFATH